MSSRSRYELSAPDARPTRDRASGICAMACRTARVTLAPPARTWRRRLIAPAKANGACQRAPGNHARPRPARRARWSPMTRASSPSSSISARRRRYAFLAWHQAAARRPGPGETVKPASTVPSMSTAPRYHGDQLEHVKIAPGIREQAREGIAGPSGPAAVSFAPETPQTSTHPRGGRHSGRPCGPRAPNAHAAGPPAMPDRPTPHRRTTRPPRPPCRRLRRAQSPTRPPGTPGPRALRLTGRGARARAPSGQARSHTARRSRSRDAQPPRNHGVRPPCRLGPAHPSMRERRARDERLAFKQGGDPRELVGCGTGHLQVARRNRDFDLRLKQGRAAEFGMRRELLGAER